MVSIIPVQKQTYNLKAKTYATIPLRVVNATDGFYLIFFFLNQPGATITQHLQVHIKDKPNYDLWCNNDVAVRAGANPSLLKPSVTIQDAYVSHALVSFIPPVDGDYFIILDNLYGEHSQTDKNVLVQIDWVVYEPSVSFIKNSLLLRNWKEVWGELEKANISALSKNKLNEVCYELRTAMALLLLRICKALEKKDTKFDPGKSTDISELINILKTHGVPEDVAGYINKTWSFVSERGHIEKTEGAQPPLQEVTFGFKQTLLLMEYLLTLHIDIYL